MKTKFYALFSIIMASLLLGCNSRFNEDIMYSTVGSKLEKQAPGEVSQPSSTHDNKSVTLTWYNPGDNDLYGVKITPSVPEYIIESKNLSVPDPVSISKLNTSEVLQSYTFYNLENDIEYTFEFKTYDKNLNYSSGKSITGTPSNNVTIKNVEENSIHPITGDSFVKLIWKNDLSENTIEGIKITCKNANTSEVSTILLPKDNNIIPETYTFNNLTNGTIYNFNIYQYTKSNESSGRTVSATPAKGVNKMQVTDCSTDSDDSSIILSWTNPNDEDFYGLQIQSIPSDGNLSSPVYFMKKTSDTIPSSFTVTGLKNNNNYKFAISTLDKDLNLSQGVEVYGRPNPKINNIDVTNLRAIPGNGFVDLYWTNPSDTSLLKQYEITVSPSLEKINITDLTTNSYRITGLTNGTIYTFSLYTINISDKYSNGAAAEARPDAGSSGIFDNKDLIRYKNTCFAYDFGYCNQTTTKTLRFTSSSQMDLTNNPISTVTGKNGVFSIISSQNITDGSYGNKTAVKGEEFEITIQYTPSQYNHNKETASWDEADIKIGGISDNTIRVIGSNYPQPSSISSSENELRIWLRADMISSSNLFGKRVISLPDYSGNDFHANSIDPDKEKIPSYIEKDPKFNNLPVIDFSNSIDSTGQPQQQTQLIATGRDGIPIVKGTNGSTTFIVFVPGHSQNQFAAEQTILSTNYGTSWPTLKITYRDYNSNGWYVSNDRKFGLAVKGCGMAGTWRFACISNETKNNPLNRMLLTGANTNAKGLTDKSTLRETALGACLLYNRDISPSRYESEDPDFEWDYPSNIQMYVNGEERLLAYFESISGTYTETYLTNNKGSKASIFMEANGINTLAQYGLPWGDGKGHRYGSLPKKLLNPRNTSDPDYINWLEAIKNIEGRPYDRALTYNTPYETNSLSSGENETASAATGSDHFENWLPKDIWKNGTINTITLGADFNTSKYCYSKIAEVFIFEGHLSKEQIEEMNNYIKYKYNLSDIPTDVSYYYE